MIDSWMGDDMMNELSFFGSILLVFHYFFFLPLAILHQIEGGLAVYLTQKYWKTEWWWSISAWSSLFWSFPRCSWWGMMYVGHFEVWLDDFLSGGPVVHKEEGKMECSFCADRCALFYGNACIVMDAPSELRTMYSTAPSTKVIALSTSSITISWAIGCCA